MDKLILCANTRQKEGWKHHDVLPLDGIDIQCDLHEIDKFVSAESCEEIEFTHALEHFPTIESVPLLKLIHSLLAPGGKLYVEVPNFKWHCQLLLNEYREEDAVYYAFGGQLDEYDFHKTGFTSNILKSKLKQAGFRDIVIEGNDTLRATCYK